MHPTTLIPTLLAALLGLEPHALRSQLDSAPWRPPVDRPANGPTETPSPAGTDPVPTANPTPPSPTETPPPPSGGTATRRMDSEPVWQLQLAALANPEVARREQARLEKSLGAGSIRIVLENGLSKLRWGAFPSREAADAARGDLKTYRLDGFPVKTVP